MYYFRQLEHIGRLAKKLCRAMAEAIIRHYIDISASNVTSKKVVILASPPSNNEEMNVSKVQKWPKSQTLHKMTLNGGSADG